MIEENPAHGKNPMSFPVAQRHHMREKLADGIGILRTKRGLLVAGLFGMLAKHLSAGSLKEANLKVGRSNRLQQVDYRQAVRRKSADRLLPGQRHKRLGRQIVDLRESLLLEESNQVRQIIQVNRAVVNIRRVRPVGAPGAPPHSGNAIALFQEQTREVVTILAVNAGYRRADGN